MYQDRLVNSEDRTWFDDLCKKKMEENFGTKFEEVVTTDALIYGDFMTPNVDNRPYQEVKDQEKVGTNSA